jgi:hypothetical protein
VAGGGCTFSAAQAELGRCVSESLVGLATEAPSFKEFRAAVEMFFQETDGEALRAWLDAVARVRAERLSGDVIGLETQSADDEIGIEVAEVARPAESSADNNYSPEAALAA